MAKYRKKPVVIDAWQWLGQPFAQWPAWLQIAGTKQHPSVEVDHLRRIYIPTLEGMMRGELQDWIIRGVNGEVYPCKPDIFEQTYEPA